MKMIADWRKKGLAALLAFVMALSLMVAAFPLNVRAEGEPLPPDMGNPAPELTGNGEPDGNGVNGPVITFHFPDGWTINYATEFSDESGTAVALGDLLREKPISYTDEHEHVIQSVGDLIAVIGESVYDAPEILGLYSVAGQHVTDAIQIRYFDEDISVYPKFKGLKVYELTATIDDPDEKLGDETHWMETLLEDVALSDYGRSFYVDEETNDFVTTAFTNVKTICAAAGWYSAETTAAPSDRTNIILEVAHKYDRIIATSLFRVSDTAEWYAFNNELYVTSATTLAQALAQSGEKLLRGESRVGADVLGWSKVIYDTNGEPIRDAMTYEYLLEDKVYTTAELLALPVASVKNFHFVLRTADVDQLGICIDNGEASWPIYEMEWVQTGEDEWSQERVCYPQQGRAYETIPDVSGTFGQILTACDISTDRTDLEYNFGERTFKGWSFAKIDPKYNQPMYDESWEVVPEEGAEVYTWEQLQALPMSTLKAHAVEDRFGGVPQVFLCAVWEEPASQYVFPFEISLRGGSMTYTYQQENSIDDDGNPVYENRTETSWGLSAPVPRTMTKVSDILKATFGFIRFDTAPSMTDGNGQPVDFLGFVRAETDSNGMPIEDEDSPGNVKSKDGNIYTVEEMLNYVIPDAQSAKDVVFAAIWDFKYTPAPGAVARFEGVDALLIDGNHGFETLSVKTPSNETFTETSQYFFADNRTEDRDAINRGSITLADPVRQGYVFEGWEVYRVDKVIYYGSDIPVSIPAGEELIGAEKYEDNDQTPPEVFYRYYTVRGRVNAPEALMSTADVNANILPHPEQYGSIHLKAKWKLDDSRFKIQTEDITEMSTPMAQHHASLEDFRTWCIELLVNGRYIPRLDGDNALAVMKQVDVYHRTSADADWEQLSDEDQADVMDFIDVVLPLPEGYKPGMTISVLHVKYVDNGASDFSRDWDVFMNEDIEFVDDSHIKVVADTTSPFVVVAGNLKTIESKLLAGSDRYETCAKIAKEAFDGFSAPSEVVFVTGANFPDALTANGFAGARMMPVLMTRRASVPDAIKKLLKDEWKGSVKTAYVIGGGFEQSFFNDLKALGVETINNDLKGADRYKTADAVLKYGMDNGYFDNSTLVIATGAKAADALSMSSYCYTMRAPMVLTNKYGELKPETKALIRKYGFDRVIVAGAESCCKTSELKALGYSEEKGNLIRLSGDDRYATSVEIAKFFFAETGFNETTGLCLAPGGDANFPDALVGGMLAAMYCKPMLLVGAKESSTKSYDYLTNRLKGDMETTHIYALGFCKDPSIANRIKAMLAEVNKADEV
ncbi:MAG: cell wall-binding repeat-containing protein [Lachnospiraceae bacterium]|nr:cell wall-binding repeat-containing protein [Lachnospiraceae bacterium]